jgi:hypothetical protein
VKPRDGAIIFRDLIGKLAVLGIECGKCGRSGQHRLDRLIMRYGIDGKLFDSSGEITADCGRRGSYRVARLVKRYGVDG